MSVEAQPEIPFWLSLTDPDIEAINDLNDALTRLETNGWQRGKLHNLATGECCALGAFGFLFPQSSPGVPYLAYAVRQRVPKLWERNELAAIIRYNDEHAKSIDDIRAVFRDAVRLAEGAGTQVRAGYVA